MAKDKTPEEMLKQYSAELVKSIERYKSIIEHGCSDPSWPDGCCAETTFWHTSDTFWISARLTIWKSHRSITCQRRLNRTIALWLTRLAKGTKG